MTKETKQKHSAACTADWERYEQELAAFEARYPGYCRTCGGTGELRYIENGAPHGAGYWPMLMIELCEDCMGRCPRCGYTPTDWTEAQWDRFYDGMEPCPVCGFIHGEQDQWTAPPEPECDYWPEYADQEDR